MHIDSDDVSDLYFGWRLIRNTITGFLKVREHLRSSRIALRSWPSERYGR